MAALCVGVGQGAARTGALSPFTPGLAGEGERHLIPSRRFVVQTKGGKEM